MVRTPLASSPKLPAMAEYSVRPARPSETDVIGEITVAAFDAAGLLHDNEDYAAELGDAAERFRHAELLVAVDDTDSVAGSVTVMTAGSPVAEICRTGELEFRMLSVRPHLRRHRIGELLTDAVLDHARERGLAHVVLSVADDNFAAIGLYERLGFVRLPERDWDPVPTVHLLVFGRDVAAANPATGS